MVRSSQSLNESIYLCILLFRHLSSAPFDKDLVCSCYGAVEDGRSQVHSALWKIQQEEGPLQSLTALQHNGGNFRWLVIQLLMTAIVLYICTAQCGTQTHHHNWWQ